MRPRPGHWLRQHLVDPRDPTSQFRTPQTRLNKNRTIAMNAFVSEQLSKQTQHEANTRANQARLARLAQARDERPTRSARSMSWRRRLVPAPR